MDRWIAWAIVSMFFAGFTSVVAKQGLIGISGELGLVVRTTFVCVLVAIFAIFSIPAADVRSLTRANIFWLFLSGITTTCSWVFYYKALKAGDVATVALIDKGSVVVAMLLAWLLLKETITARMILGATLIISGLLVIARR